MMSEDILNEIEAAAETVADMDRSWWPTVDAHAAAVSQAIQVQAGDIAARHGENKEKVADFIKHAFWRI